MLYNPKRDKVIVQQQQKVVQQQKHSKFVDEDEQSHEIIGEDHIYYIPYYKSQNQKAKGQLISVVIVCFIFMLIEVLGGYFANSLAIMTDAAHLFSDVSGFFISIFSITLSSLPSDKKMTYGYNRAEVIGALTSVQFIWGLTIWLMVEAVYRIMNPPVVDSKIMFIVSVLGLFFNLIMMKILHSSPSHSHAGHNHDHEESDHSHDDHSHDDHRGHNHDSGDNHAHNTKEVEDENINVKAAFIHIIGDTIQSLGVILASIIIYFGGQKYAIADPICTFLFAILVIFTTIPIAKDCFVVLMEGIPINIEIDKFKQDLNKIQGVISVHDLHVWSISSGRFALSAHIISKTPELTLTKSTELCKRYKIYHSTLQIENPDEKSYNAVKCETNNVC